MRLIRRSVVFRLLLAGSTLLIWPIGAARIISPMAFFENHSPRRKPHIKWTPMSKRAIAHLSSDPVMSALIERVGIIRLCPRRLPPFQSLAHAIIHQQLNSNAAGTILERFKRLFPDDEFPTPGQVAENSVERLRTAGLSRPKAAYIIDLARRCDAGLIPTVNDCDSLWLCGAPHKWTRLQWWT